jgi:hypothetical protein
MNFCYPSIKAVVSSGQQQSTADTRQPTPDNQQPTTTNNNERQSTPTINNNTDTDSRYEGISTKQYRLAESEGRRSTYVPADINKHTSNHNFQVRTVENVYVDKFGTQRQCHYDSRLIRSVTNLSLTISSRQHQLYLLTDRPITDTVDWQIPCRICRIVVDSAQLRVKHICRDFSDANPSFKNENWRRCLSALQEFTRESWTFF